MSSLDRAAKYGGSGAIAVAIVQIGMVVIIWGILTEAGLQSRAEAAFFLVFFGVVGTSLAVVLLFVIIGRYLHRELEARGLDGPER